MTPSAAIRPYTCARCLRANRRPIRLRTTAVGPTRRYANAAAQAKEAEDGQHGKAPASQVDKDGGEEKEEGAFTRRMREMSEEALESGGHGAIKAVEEAGFSADLKAQLEQRIAAANLRSSEADLRRIRLPPYTRPCHYPSMDWHRPMRLGRPPRPPGATKEQRGVRLANARDRSGIYVSVKTDEELDAEDREKQLQELKDRFDPNARVIVPGDLNGLASLANKRIEDAIARGQFKNIPRGKGMNVERDHNANSPFIDTTEYFMNKIIQKQELVPPWIEKQQELTSAASKFRSRLRVEWKRHASRMIASKGGSLADQIRRAEAYAKAELISNPPKRKQEVLTTVGKDGQLSQISLSGELKVTSPLEGSSETAPVVTEEIVAQKVTLDNSSESSTEPVLAPDTEAPSTQTLQVSITVPTPSVPPAPFPFRDPDWERIESGYHTLAIADLNSKARSYNLQAPELAKRPYFNLQRELNACFADVAPQLPQAILDRARAPPKKTQGFGQAMADKSLFGNMVGAPVRIRDERTTKQYGFRQFWKDLWAKEPPERL
ncbi:hypothetical protein SNOG_14349 [Parastagonospora nodorum SN15]|uniref:DnaJ homologue subfamily C member 28 conserved domain-containing protein n=1 Tax=Phaeosphaeria nodorum (strain SN15 / ATCC MYA-4574 / FGSC 10173) TaxID=321614 RepID=Q0U1G4_PHANO|nr:hypothetical protein SNOG_14349 [Parastagonospora nodorum SN15]EAT78220.1 hypothetical protein SNOG_14349 [Parastagonospora nodorum SN15]